MVEEARRLAVRHGDTGRHDERCIDGPPGRHCAADGVSWPCAITRTPLRAATSARWAVPRSRLAHPAVGTDRMFELLGRDAAWVAEAERWLQRVCGNRRLGAERSVMSWAARAGRASLRSAAVNRAVRALARLRGNDLVLVYHRVGPLCRDARSFRPSRRTCSDRNCRRSVKPSTSLRWTHFWRRASRTRQAGRRPRVAITFDDDLPSHVEAALPILRELGAPATFFLSGRALHGLGAYWFQHLEALLVAHGEHRAAAVLGLPGARGAELVLACEANADVRRRATEAAADLPAPDVLDRAGMASLGAAGMTIGFHTVQHDILPALTDAALQQAVSYGRDGLGEATGAAIRYFAYPHGKTDARSAAAVRAAGFEAAFTGRAQPLRRDDDRYRLGRWEPGALGVDDLLVNLAVRLHRVAPASREGAP